MLPLSRVHLAVWHQLSTFIDIHLLHLVKKKEKKPSYKHTPPVEKPF